MESMCEVLINGKVCECVLVKENNKTVIVKLLESEPRTVIRKKQYNLRDIMEQEGQEQLALMVPFDKTIGIPEEVEVPGRTHIKRHKVKHNFRRL